MLGGGEGLQQQLLLPRGRRPRQDISRRLVDSGWAWVVAAAAFGIFGLQAGSSKICGLVYVHMLEHFRSDPKVTIWVVATSGVIAAVSEPLASAVLMKTSHRFVTVIGSILAAAGAAATGCIPRIEAGFLTFGLLYGLGMACLSVSSLTCCEPYFNRYRGLAASLTSGGAGVMSIVLPVVMTILFETDLFGGGMFMFAGFLLQAAALGCLLRPPATRSEHSKRQLAQAVATETLATRSYARSSAGGGDGRLGSAADSWRKCSSASAFSHADKYVCDGDQRGQCNEVARSVEPAADAAGSASHFFDVSVLGEEKTLMIGLIGLFSANGLTIVFTAMYPQGDSVGLPRATTSMLIAVGGALEIFCRGMQCWFGDRHVMPILVQLGLCTGLTGIAAALCPIIGGAAGIGLLAALCGAGGTSIYALITIAMRELLGPEKVNSAMGIFSLLLASSHILSTLAVVYLTERYGSWHYVFYYIGGNLMASSVFCMGYALVLRTREDWSALGV